MFKSKLSKVIVSLLRRIAGVTRSGAKRLMRAMLQALMAMGRRARLPVAGFVLPTVTMVLLVVILLTVAIVLRSFDRANIARNVRVNQQVLAAATPALDRAKAKINFLLYEDPQRPTSTPSDADLHARLSFDGPAPQPDLYTFGDEKRLILRQDLDDSGTADPADNPKGPLITGTGPTTKENEALNTAWRYPVDTNNDGKFDTFTMYGVFFRTPNRGAGGELVRARRPLDARTPPTSAKGFNPNCIQGGGTVASLVGDSGWYKLDGKLKKSFFVYTVNVPIKQEDIAANSLGSEYQPFTGTTSISALEYQQDQSRIPLSNNAVVYEDDLDISPGPTLNLNGRIFTNSNLLVTNLNGPDRTRLYQVSSPDSCFYEQENSKIIVAGNVVNGWSGSTIDVPPIPLPLPLPPIPGQRASESVGVHLFRTFAPGAGGRNATMLAAARTISKADGAESATNSSLNVLYNNKAYADRLSLLVAAQMGPPDPVTDLPNPDQPSDPLLVKQRPKDTQTREQALREYFKQMLRKVPFAEVGLNQPAIGAYNLTTNLPIISTGGDPETLRPRENSWMIPDATTNIALRPNQLATTPKKDNSPPEQEEFLGDRLVAGNNLPAIRWDGSTFTSKEETIAGSKWNAAATAEPDRTRSPQVIKLADVGATDRGGFWEGAAAEQPRNPLAGVGGLRVITGAGVYERTNSFLPPPTWINPLNGTLLGNTLTDRYNDPATPDLETYPVVWPDSMPMSPVPGAQRVYNNGATDTVAAANTWAAVALPAPLPPPPTAPPTIDPTTPKYAKGDLRMRATAVYHYELKGSYDATVPSPKFDSVRPFACVSSYYDPSTAETARNITSLPDSSGLLATGLLPAARLPAQATVTRSATVGSNNGVVYGPPTTDRTQDVAVPGAGGLLSTTPNDLGTQANYVFPDGRFANEPLRDALKKLPAERNLADKAAIDSTVCALQILANPTGNAATGGLTDGVIQEVAFLNAREIKAVDRDDPRTPNVNEAFTLSSPLSTATPPVPPAAQLTGNYNLPLEEREPLEIRATQIDIGQLRGVPIGDEYLLPNSGIIYASRDDALPDRSARIVRAGKIDKDRSATVSPTDSLLDPSRKPNGILLVNGAQLARNPGSSATVSDVVREKGLTLVSNLPVYIQGNFNLHTKQEFKGQPFSWDTFYDRTSLDENFACRPNDPRLNGKCTTGDDWRPANVLGDSVTMLSQNYRFGFRNEGDFDLRNNAGAAAVLPRRQQGFFNNNFVTNGLSSGAFSDNGNLFTGTGARLTDTTYADPALLPPILSSYFNNFVTPVQRRGRFPKYLMEVCPKLPVSTCEDKDWFVNPATGRKAALGAYILPDPANSAASQAGSTVDPPIPTLQRFPRRVAFNRDISDPDSPQLQTPDNPRPFGITGGNIALGVGELTDNALWFAANSGGTLTYDDANTPFPVNTSLTVAGTTDGSRVPLPTLAARTTPLALPVLAPPAPYTYNGSQPLLVPVPQLLGVTPAVANTPRGAGNGAQNTGWVPRAAATPTTFNLIMAAGDTPSRALNDSWGDFNGGLQNLPRFLEIWSNGAGNLATNILGSFIQQNRSTFSTAPYLPVLPGAANFPVDPVDRLASLFSLSPTPAVVAPVPLGESLTTYNIQGGRIPYFTPPDRNWGYDVGLLSQPPDLFTQKFTTPPSRPSPDEYFREVPRNDEWVTALMCSKLAANNLNATSSRPSPNCPA